MKIKLDEIPIRAVAENYSDTETTGVRGYNNLLDIRPPYQREFVYKDKQRDEVIRTVKQGFPLNVLYWARNPDGSLECLDGQQRLISICQYVHGAFSLDFRFFHNLIQEEKDQILDYKLMVYFCEGTEKEKLDWFKTINIAGVQLTDQELRNAIYTGSWLADAKKYFSKSGGPAYSVFGDYMNGSAIRQDYLETVIKWLADAEGVATIEDYMARHQHDTDASAAWAYFQKVVNWVRAIFKIERKKLMKGAPWGLLYNKYGTTFFDPDAVESEILALIADDDVQDQKGIYQYIFDRDERHLKLRVFDDRMKLRKYEEQGHKCAMCGEAFEFSEMDGDHVLQWRNGGHTTYDNLQMLCHRCNRGERK